MTSPAAAAAAATAAAAAAATAAAAAVSSKPPPLAAAVKAAVREESQPAATLFSPPQKRIKSEAFSDRWFECDDQIGLIHKPVKCKDFAPNMSKPPYDYTRSVFNVLRNDRVSQLLYNFLKTRARDEQYEFVSR